MRTPLTLHLDDQILTAAERYAQQQGHSLAELVEQYLQALPQSEPELSPKVRRLKGIVKVSQDFNYEAAMEEERLNKHLHG